MIVILMMRIIMKIMIGSSYHRVLPIVDYAAFLCYVA